MDPVIGKEVHPPGGSTAVRARIPYLDVARGWAILGVVMVHSLSAPFVDRAPTSAPDGAVTTLVTSTIRVLFEGASRSLLAMLIGIGLVLTWRSAARRGESPFWFLVRRYVTLFVVFGLPHWYFFRPDILAHYSLVVLVMVPLLPWLLGGPRWRPLALVAACVPLPGVLQFLFPLLPGYPFELFKAPMTLMALAVGMWIARFGEFGTPPAAGRRALRISGWGLAGAVAGAASLAGTMLVFRWAVDGEAPSALASFGSAVMFSFGLSVLGIGRASVYFGLIWWLVDRDRGAARVLGVLAPLGRMSLTVYLGSTVVYRGGMELLLLVTGLTESDVSPLAQVWVGVGYAVVMAVVCPLWLRSFRHGPLEWLWRYLATALSGHPRRKDVERVPVNLQ